MSNKNYPGNESFTITLTDLWYFSMKMRLWQRSFMISCCLCFRSKIDLLCLEERGIVNKMKLVLLRELLNVLCNIKEYYLETKQYCEQNETLQHECIFYRMYKVLS